MTLRLHAGRRAQEVTDPSNVKGEYGYDGAGS